MTMRLRDWFFWGLFGAALVVLSCQTAHAQTCSATLSWQAPTENTDGSPLTDLDAYQVYWGPEVDGEATLGSSELISDAAALGHVVEGLTPGLRYYFGVTAINSAGTESALSNLATKTCPAVPIVPNPPGGLTAETELVVYDRLEQTDRAVMLPVGTVPAGTPCDTAEMVVAAGVNYYAVPQASVAWAGNVRPLIVYARCGA